MSFQPSERFLKNQEPTQAEKVTPESDKPLAAEPNATQTRFGRAIKQTSKRRSMSTSLPQQDPTRNYHSLLCFGACMPSLSLLQRQPLRLALHTNHANTGVTRQRMRNQRVRKSKPWERGLATSCYSWGSPYLPQPLESVQVANPLIAAQPLGDDSAQLGVAEGQPAARGDSIGLILELVGPQLVEAVEDLGEQNSKGSVHHSYIACEPN